MNFTAPCFSGECEFCPECCKSDDNDSKNNNGKDDNNDNDDESLQRAKDLNKFIDKQRLEDEKDHYNKSLNKLIKQYDYRNPTDIGFMPTKKNYGEDEEYKQYKLQQENHKEICDDQLCKLFYVSSHDNIKSSYYTKLPIYSRVKDNNHNLCIVCISR